MPGIVERLDRLAELPPGLPCSGLWAYAAFGAQKAIGLYPQ